MGLIQMIELLICQNDFNIVNLKVPFKKNMTNDKINSRNASCQKHNGESNSVMMN